MHTEVSKKEHKHHEDLPSNQFLCLLSQCYHVNQYVKKQPYFHTYNPYIPHISAPPLKAPVLGSKSSSDQFPRKSHTKSETIRGSEPEGLQGRGSSWVNLYYVYMCIKQPNDVSFTDVLTKIHRKVCYVSLLVYM